MANYFQEELKRKDMAHYIPQMEKVLAAREGIIEEIDNTQCQCWQEISCLNKDAAKYIQMSVDLINPADEEGGYIKINNWQHKIMDCIHIRYCPLCGRTL